jgi:hypothetical protein
MACQSCCRALLVTHGCPSRTPGRRLRARTGRVRCGSSTEVWAAGHLHAGQGRSAGRTRLPRHGILPGHPPRLACATEGLSSLVPPPCALANTVSSPRARRSSQANVVMNPGRQPRRIATCSRPRAVILARPPWRMEVGESNPRPKAHIGISPSVQASPSTRNPDDGESGSHQE